jgi:hypothetical protein
MNCRPHGFSAILLSVAVCVTTAEAQAPSKPLGEAQIVEGAQGRVLAMAVSPDGKRLVTAGYDVPGDDSGRRAVRLWDIARREQIRMIVCDCDSINAVAFSADGDYVAAGDDEGTVLCWEVQTGRQLFRTPGSDSPVTGLVFRRDRPILVSGSDKFYGWDARSGKRLGEVASPDDWSINCLTFSADGSVIAAGVGLQAVLLNSRTLQPLRVLPDHTGGVETIALSKDKKRIATGCNNGDILLWEANKPAPIHSLLAHENGVNCLAFVENGETVVSGGNDGKLRLWDFQSGRQKQEIAASTLSVDSLVVTPDEKLLINNDIIRLQVRSVGGSAGAKTSPAPAPNQGTTLDLTDLALWEIVRGTWEKHREAIVASGDSRINSKPTFPNDFVFRCKLKVNGPTNPRIRFGSFHFGYEGREPRFFLHGPKATGEPFPFTFGQTYDIEVRMQGDHATLLIDGANIATSNPKRVDERVFSLEGGGARSVSSAEFSEISVTYAEQDRPNGRATN